MVSSGPRRLQEQTCEQVHAEFDTEYRCQSLNTPTCGYCCSLSPGNDCPDGCSVETAEKVGSGTTGGFVCEAQCSEAPEGAGAENEDLHIFVTIQDSTECQNSDVLLAFATSCGVDQCDRPIFGTINFCPQKLENGVDMLVSTAVHELAHVLVFSNVHFRNFRYSNGTPMIPRAADDDSNFQNEITYTCSSTGYEWGASPGNYKYVDMSPNIVNAFSERGYSCQCPIGTSSITAGCFYPSPPYLQVPSCVVRMTTPTVLAEARSFFDCPTLDGAELENQEGNGCSIIGSHWEQRVFAGEIMSPVSTERLVETYVSRVSLAVFQDSGWYKPNMSAADPVVKGAPSNMLPKVFAPAAEAAQNVNFMREVFSNNSRCFMSTLHADAPADGGGQLGSSELEGIGLQNCS
ncbi:Leishmanolysin-like peptidase (Invadolysin) [Durusdinium trenchii]|uniref:Leishmanolysin-like peptidase (Invadolysin) n=1 Tax=Durusdinium trenchii TaxID=1381693 RepID=A0ABP0NDA6_9DINO